MKKEHFYIVTFSLLTVLLVIILIVGGIWVWNSAYAQGLSHGHAQGYRQGASDGYTAGYSQGKNDGYSSGKTAGYTAGYAAGKTAGYSQGVTDGSNGQQSHGAAVEKSAVFTEIENLGCKTYDDGSVIVRMTPNGLNNFKFSCA
jgi:hypothetical protein